MTNTPSYSLISYSLFFILILFVYLSTPPSYAKIFEHIRIENAIDENKYDAEVKLNINESKHIYASHQDSSETEGFEYTQDLAYFRFVQRLNPTLFTQLDVGLAYETYGKGYLEVNEVFGASDYFNDSSLAAWSTVSLNYLAHEKLLIGLDFTASDDIKNESLSGMYRSRINFLYKPHERVTLVYRGGLTYTQNDFARLVSAPHLVSDNFLVSHELYAAYRTSIGLETYFVVKDLNNSGDRNIFLGGTYFFN